MASSMEVRGIGLTSHSANEYARVDFYLPGKDGRTAYFQREVHLVENLKANLLMGIDIISPEGIDIYPSREVATVKSCGNIELALLIRTHSANIQRTVFTQKETCIPAHTRKALPIQGAKGGSLNLPQDRDMLFEPSIKQKVSVFAHIVNHSMEAIYVQNDSDSDVVLPRNTRIGNIVEYEADGCFLASVNDSEIAMKPAKKSTTSWIKQAWKGVLAATVTTAAYGITTNNPNDTTQLESKLSNRATGYGDQSTIKAFNKVVDSYPDLWIDHGNTAKVPQAEWMEIPLVENWMELYKPGQARVYPVGQKDREVIDEAFNKLHEQGRIELTTESTPFTYPCFVVWKNLADGRRKGRVVVDIRALNKITLPDAYPVPSQSDILSAVSGASHITTVDCCSFFYHWLVKPEHRHRLTVSSHRGQETFKVAVMGYQNSPAYVQRMIDGILRPF
ncbi:probable transposable element [Lasallia pustulata]|uniref:Probable transposable element n=1 Tax=Lasallia pustulata TaxID=136370 RepID=A0A1W5DCX4_9LECA|nr:probable transposable element [Lasallia pustulata]